MWDRRDMPEMFRLGNLEGIQYLECKVLAGIIVVKWILKKQSGWCGLNTSGSG
jgi:hypothetical protein